MPNHVLQIDCSGGITGLEAELDLAPYSGPYSTVWIEADFAFNSVYLTALLGGVAKDEPLQLGDSFGSSNSEEILVDPAGTGGWTTFGASGGTFGGAPAGGVLSETLTALQFYRLKLRVTAGTPATADAWIDGTSLGPITMTGIDIGSLVFVEVQAGIVGTAGAFAYFDNVKVGTTEGASDILSDNFEGVGAPSASIWNSLIDATVITDPGITPPTGGGSSGLTAAFTASPTTGASPLTVTFTDTSTPGSSGPITAWAWDFGEGGTSTLQNPTHIYSATGTYTVILTVTGTTPDGTDTHVRYAYIVTDGGGGGGGGGGGAPIAAFSATPHSGSSPLTVSFTDHSEAGTSGPITAWHWTFGDGYSSTNRSPMHTYTTTGTFSVKLKVTGTDPDGSDSVVHSGFIVTDGGGGGGPSSLIGRVLVAFDDGPLEPSPGWTSLDQAANGFPPHFVAGFEITSGRQSLLAQTDTGTATVDINDHVSALFDPRNVSSPYYGKLDGSQILLQLYDPVRAVWETQFGGHIDNVLYDVDGSGVDQNGDPINVAIKLECVDIFDFLAGYGLTPGLDGVTPRVVPSGSAGGAVPAGFEDGVYYAETVGSVEDRIIEILADVGIDSTRYLVASGNVRVIAVKYDPDESALVALRDACDAEFPFIANMYVDRHGMFAFRGRGSRFDPDVVAAEPGSTWDFHRWAVGDGNAIIADATRAQMRILSYGRGRRDVINAALAYPQNIAAADMPGQVFADTASITAYGKHQAPPMSDLLTLHGTVTGNDAKQETFLFAKLLVKNQKDPRESVSSLQLKAIRPDDPRAAVTWALITQADISHIVNVAVGYPSGTGLAGDSPEDDYYIEGRHLRVTPLNPDHDYVELDLEVSPAVWSMDTHSVFPPSEPGAETPTVLTADFTTA